MDRLFLLIISTTGSLIAGPTLAQPCQFFEFTRTAYGTGARAQFVEAGDMNEDGLVDLLVSNLDSDSLRLFFNQGNGAFTAGNSIETGSFPNETKLVDLNQDQHLDLIVTNRFDDRIDIRFGDGSGSFGPPTSYTALWQPVGIGAGDLDNDGDIDIMISTAFSSTAWLFWNRGDGEFEDPISFGVAGSSTTVSFDDLNLDGALDITVLNHGTHKLSVCINNGNGLFPSNLCRVYNISGYPRAHIIKDFNNDSIPDIAYTSPFHETVEMRMGDGAGGFGQRVKYIAGGEPYGIASSDINGDGFADLAVSNFADGNISIFLNQGDGVLVEDQIVAAGGGSPAAVLSADLNNDGDFDIVTVDAERDRLQILSSNCNEFCTADFNSSDSINFIDLLAFLDVFYAGLPIADINGDGRITFFDLSAFLQAFHAGCP